MKVAFFTPHVLWKIHYQTDLELMQSHLDQGDEVVQLVCNAELPTCDTNLDHNIHRCLTCMGCRDYGKSLISVNYTQKSFLNLSAKDKEEISSISKDFKDVKELQKLKVDNFDLGYAVASSLISLLRDPTPDLNKHRDWVHNYIVSSLAVYKSFINFLKESKIDRVYVFNGRFAQVKPVLRACQFMKVDCYIQERGNSKNHYALFKNTTPHDISYIEGQIKNLWAAANSEKRVEQGEEFFLNRAKGVSKSWFSFTKEQIEGLLPEGWDATKKNIVVFNSSEDEFASIGEDWNNPLYTTQLDGLKEIIADLSSLKDIHLYLRVHPNLKAVSNTEKKLLYQLQGENFTLIPAESPVSTYDLIKAADKIVTFGSTVGIEAVYWGKPSILAGKTFYYNLGGTYNPSSHSELIELISSKLEPKPIEPALMYGFYLNTFGIPYKYYHPETLFEGNFRGHYIIEKAHVKYKFIDWLLWKPIIRNYNTNVNKLHQKYLLKNKYLR